MDLENIRNYNIYDFLQSDYFISFINNNNIKNDCYFDFDGVLYDTIVVSFKEMGLDYKKSYDSKVQEKITKYYKNVNWLDLINRSNEINNSLNKIKFIKELNIFNNIAIATHRNTYFNEGLTKRNLIKEKLNITVFDIPINIAKETALNANNNILIDDSRTKIINWTNAGGIGILFNQDVNELILPNENCNYYITNDLLDIIKVIYINNLLKEKDKVKIK